MTAKGASVIAAATSGQHPSQPAAPSGSRAPCRVTTWVHLDAEPVSNGAAIVLAPGRNYVLSVTVAQASDDEPSFTVRGDLVLQAGWVGDPDVRVDDAAKEVAVASLPDTPVRTFHIQVSEQALRTVGRLAVTARDRTTGRLQPIYECAVEILAELRAPPSGFAATAIQLARDPDPQLAMLHVHGSGQHVLVDGFHASSSRLESKRIGRPTLDFVRAEVDKYSAPTIINHIVDYSQQGAPEVRAWLSEVLHNVNAGGSEAARPLAIIIVEQVDSHVPWEMLTLEDRTVLGARAVVTRWIVMSPQPRAAIALSPVASSGRRGRVLSYVDHDDTDLHALADLLKQRWQKPYELPVLVRKLGDPPDGLALVMLTCHGILVQDADGEVKYGSQKQSAYKQITRTDLVGIAASAETRPLVFVNACHSARLRPSKQDTLGLPIGLPEAFLRGYARGYLGTIGAIKMEFAVELGTLILEKASASIGVCLPELLFELRRKAAENRRTDPTTFVNTFMYVFYGSPRERLMLAPQSSSGGGHE